MHREDFHFHGTLQNFLESSEDLLRGEVVVCFFLSLMSKKKIPRAPGSF